MSLDKSLSSFDFGQLIASDFGKDKLVKLIVKVGDGVKKSELGNRDMCMEYLAKLGDKLTVKDLAGVVNSAVSSSMVVLMQYQFQPEPTPETEPEPVAPIEPEPAEEKPDETENKEHSVLSIESGEIPNEKPANVSKTSDTASTSSINGETWKCMENLLEKLAKVAITSEKDNQPASMPPVYHLEDNPVSFKSFCYTELARWFRFEKIADTSRREYFPYVFNDEEFALRIEKFVQDDDADATYDYTIDAVSELVERQVSEIQDRKANKEKIEEFNTMNDTAWEICDSPNKTPRQSLIETPPTNDPAVDEIQQRIAEMNIEQERLKAMQSDLENILPPSINPTSSKYPSLEDKIEADIRSVFVGQVDYACSAAEVESHFRGCGELNRVTILCDKYTYNPKGFAYVEFAHQDSVKNALALDGSYLKGRALRVLPKRTNNPTFRVSKAHGFRPRHSHVGVFKESNRNYY